MKYFAKYSSDDDSLITIYRWNSDAVDYAQDVWDKFNNTWKESKLLMEYLEGGEPYFDEINENQAKSAFPEAF